MIDESQFLEELPKFQEYDVVYVHQCFMSLFSGMLNWFSTVLYPRFNYKVITTYDKAVEVFKKKQQNADGQVQTAFLPALTLDPMLDFSNEERAGRFYWMFKNLSQPNGSIMWNKIRLVDQGVTIVPMFTRYQGTAELTAWMPSIYELMDYRTRVIQYFGGYQRWIRPDMFWTHLILPKELLTSKGPEGDIDWSGINPKIISLETTGGTKEYALPFRLDAIWRLDSFGDATNKMGADQIAEYKATCTLTWECNIPTFIRLENYTYPIHTINLNVSMSASQCRYPLDINYMTYFKLGANQKLTLMSNLIPIHNIAEKCDPVIRFDDNMCVSTPEVYKHWDHIVCGKIKKIESLKSPDDITTPDTILVMKEYKNEYLPYVRKCRGLVSRYDTLKNVDLVDLIKNYRISAVLDIKQKALFDAICSLNNKDVTFDVVAQSIYMGIKPIKVYQHLDKFEDFEFSENFSRIFKKFALEHLFKDETRIAVGESISSIITKDYNFVADKFTAQENQHEFPLNVRIENDALEEFGVSLNDSVTTQAQVFSDRIVFNEDCEIKNGDVVKLLRSINTLEYTSKLVIDYIMTREDERSFITEKKPITLDIPDEISPLSIKCVSYTGELKNKIDYIVDGENKKITFKLKPKRDEYIQVYGGSINLSRYGQHDISKQF